jgi:hypothetical protein
MAQLVTCAVFIQSVQDSLLLDRAYLNKVVMRERGGGGLGGLASGIDADIAMFGA